MDFDPFQIESHFRGSWGNSEKCFKPKTKPPLGNLASQNPRNALYKVYDLKKLHNRRLGQSIVLQRK